MKNIILFVTLIIISLCFSSVKSADILLDGIGELGVWVCTYSHQEGEGAPIILYDVQKVYGFGCPDPQEPFPGHTMAGYSYAGLTINGETYIGVTEDDLNCRAYFTTEKQEGEIPQ